MKKSQLFFVFLLLSSLTKSFAQTTVIIPLTHGSSEDAYLASGSPDINYGSHGSLGGNTWTCNGSLCNSRALFKFDLSLIPSGATITDASLQLFGDLNWSTSPTTGGPDNAGYLSRVTSAWTENVVTWNSQPGTTISNEVTIPGSSSAAQNYTIGVTSLVQDMITNTNYGFMLKMQDEFNYYKSLMFASSDNVDSTTKCPVLTISYITSPVTTTSISLCQGNSEDAYLASGSPGTNYGSHGSLGGNTWTCNGSLCNSRALFKFDLSSIPAGANISDASLQLFGDLNWSTSPTTGGPNNAGYLSRVTSAWAENVVTWNTQPSTTISNEVIIPGSSSTAQNYTIGVTGLVQDMIANMNYGFMLKMQDELNYYKSLMFASSDNINSSTKCPILTVSYSSPISVKELAQKTVINIFPNPSSDVITIESNVEIKKIIVVDLLGKLLIEDIVNSKTHRLNKELPNGIFIMSVLGQNNELLSSQKITRLN